MIFKFKKSKLNLDLFTYRKEIFDSYRIDYAKKFIPSWFKKTPINVSDTIVPSPSLKGCPGLHNIFNTGIVLPLWSDVAVFKDTENIHFQFADKKTEVNFHSKKQWETYLNSEEHFHFKISSPWSIKCKKNIKFFLTGFSWAFNPFQLHIVPGIVDFRESLETNINGFLKPFELKETLILAGQPLMHIVPLTESDITLNYHVVSYDEFYSTANKMQLYFINGFNRNKKIRRNDD